MNLEDLAKRVTALEAKVEALTPITINLTSEYDNPTVRKDPKQWLERGGASYEGRRFSECPADYLEALASLFDWKARKDEEAGKTYTNRTTGKEMPTAPLERKNAARARAWAKQKAGHGAPMAGARQGKPDADPYDANEEIPF